MPSTVFITGTSTGMGRELVHQLAKRGWNVIATMRDPRRADPAFAGMNTVRVLKVDVTDPRSVQSAVDEATAAFGQIDALINNAGYLERGTLEEVSLDRWHAQFETNVFGVVAAIHAVLPQMRARRAGHILNVSSVASQASLPTTTAYCSSKHALEGLSDGLSKEIAPLGIKVTIVYPASLETSIKDNWGRNPTLDDYDAARAAMGDFFAESPPGDLVKSMSAVADMVGADNPPLRVIVGGSYGQEWVRGAIADRDRSFADTEHIALATG